jgi:hypothetical protein
MLPYLTIPAALVKVRWCDGNSGDLPVSLEGWDPTSAMQAFAVVEMNPADVFKACGLDNAARLKVQMSWASPQGTRIRGAGSFEVVEYSPASIAFTVSTIVEGSAIGVSVDLKVCVTLSQPGGVNPLAPSRVGAILWEESFRMSVEGDGSRFPVEWADFESSVGLHAGAKWFLDWEPENPQLPILRGVRLYLNSAPGPFADAVRGGGLTLEQNRILEVLNFDIARQLLRGLATHDEIVEDGGFDDESIGATVLRLFRALFPNYSLEKFRNYVVSEPEEFESDLQSKMRLFSW